MTRAARPARATFEMKLGEASATFRGQFVYDRLASLPTSRNFGDARNAKGEPPPPAGYGVMALTGGVGRDHAGGHHILSLGGQIVAGGSTPRVRTTTINLGHLMGLSRFHPNSRVH